MSSNFSNQRALCDAVRGGSLDTIAELLSLVDVDMNYGIGAKDPPLCDAIANLRSDVVDLLIDHSCDVNVKNHRNTSALCLAIRLNLLNVVRRLLEAGCRVDREEADSSMPPIMIATEMGLEDVVQWLIDARCMIDKTNRDQETSLHLATRLGNHAIIKRLIHAGCRLNIAGYPEGRTPIHIAVMQEDILATGLLLEDEHFFKEVPSKKLNSLVIKRKENHIETTEIRRRLTCNVNTVNVTYGSPLHICAMKDNVTIAELLIQYGADVNLVSSVLCDGIHDLVTPLHCASKKLSSEMTDLLLSYKANVNQISLPSGVCYPDKQTPLHMLFQWPIKEESLSTQLEILKKLLQHKANVGAVIEKRSVTPIHLSIENYNPEATLVMLQHVRVTQDLIPLFTETFCRSSRENLLHCVVRCFAHLKNHVSHVIQLLLMLGVDINQNDFGGQTALIKALLLYSMNKNLQNIDDIVACLLKYDGHVKHSYMFGPEGGKRANFCSTLLCAVWPCIEDQNVLQFQRRLKMFLQSGVIPRMINFQNIPLVSIARFEVAHTFVKVLLECGMNFSRMIKEYAWLIKEPEDLNELIEGRTSVTFGRWDAVPLMFEIDDSIIGQCTTNVPYHNNPQFMVSQLSRRQPEDRMRILNLTEGMVAFIKWFMTEINKPAPLKILAMRYIRELFDDHKKPFKLLDKLPLPVMLKESMMFKNLSFD